MQPVQNAVSWVWFATHTLAVLTPADQSAASTSTRRATTSGWGLADDEGHPMHNAGEHPLASDEHVGVNHVDRYAGG